MAGTRWSVLVSGLLCLVTATAWATPARGPMVRSACGRDIDELASQYGVSIQCDWSRVRDVATETSGRRASDKNLVRFAPALARFFATMGRPLVHQLLHELVLCEDLRRNGVDVGGLSDGERVYVALDDYADGEAAYVRILQHEFSSNIYRSQEFSELDKWQAVSLGSYDGSDRFNRRCLDDFAFAYASPLALLKHGLLTNYAATNAENDFNVYAEKLFTDPNLVRKWAAKHPLVKQKLLMVKAVYRRAGWQGKFPDET